MVGILFSDKILEHPCKIFDCSASHDSEEYSPMVQGVVRMQRDHVLLLFDDVIMVTPMKR